MDTDDDDRIIWTILDGKKCNFFFIYGSLMNTILLMINVFSYLVDENHEILFFFNILDFGHSLSLYSRKSWSNEQMSNRNLCYEKEN